MLDIKNIRPRVHPASFVAPGAHLIGAVILKEGASVWYNCVLRADLAKIVIGENTNIQDNTVIHVDRNKKTVLGRNVTVGHGAIIHACTVEDNCLIGMGLPDRHGRRDPGRRMHPGRVRGRGRVRCAAGKKFPREVHDHRRPGRRQAPAERRRSRAAHRVRPGLPVFLGGIRQTRNRAEVLKEKNP